MEALPCGALERKRRRRRRLSPHLEILEVLPHLHLGQVELPLSLGHLVFGGERLLAIQLSAVEIHILLKLLVLLGRRGSGDFIIYFGRRACFVLRFELVYLSHVDEHSSGRGARVASGIELPLDATVRRLAAVQKRDICESLLTLDFSQVEK